jgi:two-component system phosphate regulon sensor histidine kinase PhoR
MRSPRLLWQLFPTYAAITLLTLALVGWLAHGALRRFHYRETKDHLEVTAQLVRHAVSGIDPALEPARADSLVKSLGRGSVTQITIVLPTGQVIADSERDPATMGGHGDRPEIRDALTGGIGFSRRYSHTQQQEMMYFAIPVSWLGGTSAVIRTGIPLTAVDETLRAFTSRVIAIGIGAAILAGVVSLLVSRYFARPIEVMRGAAARFAAGDLDYRVERRGSVEVAGLASALNMMARQLKSRIHDLERRNREHAALFAGMMEGVIAVDAEERMIGLNRAARQLLGVGDGGTEGRYLEEVIRNTTIQRFVRRALDSAGPVEEEIALRDVEDRFLQAHGTRLRGDDDREIGAIVVLNDVTRIRRLERLRREFVANVSHELRTPVTTIKGFLETLQEPEVQGSEDAKRFIEIAARQAERLHAIIEDLLALSRIEQEAERNEIQLEDGPIRPVLETAIQACRRAATKREVRVDLDCPPSLRAPRNPMLLEQAVINLLDNAIKYSEVGGRIEVSGSAADGAVAVRVRDFGCGIPASHHERIFERFYTVDKARSRHLGGTGLGLAIVKHIAIAHGGTVSVESEPGRGSAFVIRIPARGVEPSSETLTEN